MFSQGRVYFISAPFHDTLAVEESRHLYHSEITDHKFKDKCRHAMLKYFTSEHRTVEELDRVIHSVKVLDNGESHLVKTIEVEGFWKDDGGVYHMMECRHHMSLVFSVEFLVLNCVLQAVVVEQRKPGLATVRFHFGPRLNPIRQTRLR
jgi:hypothetical protein